MSALAFGFDDRGATFSECGDYRYVLWRTWELEKPSALFVMLNPSTADANEDDNTIRRCVGFARRWGLGGVRVVNLYAYRTKHPRELAPLGLAAIGELNDMHILREASEARRTIAAWGADTGPVKDRPAQVLHMLHDHARRVQALKLTSHGHPWHPLYVPADTVPLPYMGPGS